MARQIAKIRTGNSDVDRAVAHVVDALNPVLRSLPEPGTNPTTPAGADQPGRIYMGSGTPAAAVGAAGDFYFRTDDTATSLHRLYVRGASAWSGIL